MSGTLQGALSGVSVASREAVESYVCEMFSAWPRGSVLAAPSVPEPAEGCEPENLFFRRDQPVAAGGEGPDGWRDTCAGREAGSDFGSGAGRASGSGADGSGVGA